MMKKLCCILLAMLLILCCASALAEECKYCLPDSPCDVKWWVDTEKQLHARACFNHVEDKEDINSHVLITPWEACTLDEGGVCTGCGVDYEPDLTQEDYDIMMLESFYACSGGGSEGWPINVQVDGDQMTISFADKLFAFMDQYERPYTESSQKESVITLTQVDGEWQVQVSADGPGPWLQRMGWMEVGSISVEDGAATVEITLCGTDKCVLTTAEEDKITFPDDAAGQCDPYLTSYYCSCGFSTRDRSKIRAYFSLTEHWWVCPECGKDNRDKHMSYCNTPDNCRICGAGGIEAIVAHAPKLGTEMAYDQYTHWEVCAGCGDPALFSEYHPHYQLCESPGACAECGATDVVLGELVHSFGGTEYEHDATHHWYTCDGCGEQAKVLHSMNCSDPDADPNTCYMCDAEGVTIGEFYHNFDYSAYCKISDTQHVPCCSGCGAADPTCEPAEHIADCRTPDVCYFCFETGVTMSNYFHEGNQRMGYDETHHWLTCSACDYKVAGKGEAHMVDCTTPGECFCGATGLDFDPSMHRNVDTDTYVWDEDTCWNVCLDCNSVTNVEEHRTEKCGKNIRCDRCGRKDVNIKVSSHSYDGYGSSGVYFYDEDEHWVTCSRCGEEKHEAHVFYNEDRVCVTCGYEKPAYVSGDADGTGAVDILDALAVLQSAVGWSTPINRDAADVDGSGAVDIMDALLILQYAVGWDVELK